MPVLISKLHVRVSKQRICIYIEHLNSWRCIYKSDIDPGGATHTLEFDEDCILRSHIVESPGE